MKISLFTSVKGNMKGQLCTWAALCSLIDNKTFIAKAETIAAGDKSLKSTLPAVTWQAFFPDGRRKSELAVPNGLYMLDVDHVEDPWALWQRLAGRRKELGIRIAHKTISAQGLRLVAECRPEFRSIEENQHWLAEQAGVEFDGVCKDWARASFLVPMDYFYFLDGTVFDPEVAAPFVLPNTLAEPTVPQPPAAAPAPSKSQPSNGSSAQAATVQTHYHGMALKEIVMAWLEHNGGVPSEGDRNSRFYNLALQMRYIVDFKPAAIAAALPECGLSESEVLQVCANACNATRGKTMPQELMAVLEQLSATEEGLPTEEAFAEEAQNIDTEVNFVLPPVFRQYYDVAPDDFKKAAVICLLPVLGTLGSRLRATYLNNRMETPSFMVALEGQQASGKSFIEPMSERCLKHLIAKDDEERAKEREYDDKMKLAKLSGGRTKQERMELKRELEERPQPIIRKLPATASITKLLMRMENAQGLHLFALAVEIDTVTKAFKRGFSNLSDLLRCAFDNSLYGQDYASDTSFSGNVNIFYNTLYSGTPHAIKRFYNDSEDGTMSRTVFVTLPDQFGKKMPVWRAFTPEEEEALDAQLKRLYNVSIIDDEVQEEHVMELPFLNKRMENWMETQRELTIRTYDRTRNTFYRRCAEVGFRAGMLAYYLWGENNNQRVRSNVGRFAIWVANMMLKEFVGRVVLEDDKDNFLFKAAYNALPDEFSREQLEEQLKAFNFNSSTSDVLYRWRKMNVISKEKAYGAKNFKKTDISEKISKFRNFDS